MGIATLEPNQLVTIGRDEYRMTRMVGDSTWQLEHTTTKRIIEHDRTDLEARYAKGELRFSSSLAAVPASKHSINLSDDEWEKLKCRRLYVKAALEVPSSRRALEPVIHKIWETMQSPSLAPSYTAVIRWKRRYIEGGNDIHALADRNHAKGNSHDRFPADVRRLCIKAIDAKYLTRERGTIQDALDYAHFLIKGENSLRPESMALAVPARQYIRRLIDLIPAFDRYAARFGHDAAVKYFRYVGRGNQGDAPLQRAEIDHTILDLFVIDDDSLLPLGRPYVTCCIDTFTRCILGIHISFTPPSYHTVACCLKHAFMPKHDLRQQFPEITNDWAAFGVMMELSLDNGLELHSRSIKEACYSLGIELHYAARKTPWFKGKIERFFGTLNKGLAHSAPGTTFSNILERGDYDPAKHAVIRASALKLLVYKWIADYYHQKPHRALGMSPSKMWSSSVTPDTIRFAADPTQFDAILGRQYKRELTHKGIEFERLLFNSPELASIARKYGYGHSVELRVNEEDLGTIYVLHPKVTAPVRVPALREDYAPGLSLWQHKVIRRYQLQHRQMADNADGWLKAKEEISELIAKELHLKRKSSHKRIARFTNAGASISPSNPSLSTPQPPSASHEDKLPIGANEILPAMLTDIAEDDVEPFAVAIQERSRN